MNKASLQKVLKQDEDVDYAAAGVKDLNNFKGYHNNNNKTQEIEKQHDPETGAHFRHSDIYAKLMNVLKNKTQEKLIEKLTGAKVNLDPVYFSGENFSRANRVSPSKVQSMSKNLGGPLRARSISPGT